MYALGVTLHTLLTGHGVWGERDADYAELGDDLALARDELVGVNR